MSRVLLCRVILFFSDVDETTFLAEYWQRKPLVLRQSLPHIINRIDGNDLAGLACEDEVESRIVTGYGLNNDWCCRQGPFAEEDFLTLPDKNWTLLIQGLDQWSPEHRDILNYFHFLPRWRLEDIMASYAPLGGGVGPHFDYYDVFLIQASGSREWQLGQVCDENSALQNNREVKLLSEFSNIESHQLYAGDILYIPAGRAHWGTAITNDCITLSVGFRAPSEKELLTRVFDNLVDGLSEHRRYCDTLNTIDEHSSKINQFAQSEVSQFLNTLDLETLQSAIHTAFGELLTEPRYSPVDELTEQRLSHEPSQQNTLHYTSEEDLLAQFKQQGQLHFTHAPHSRFAFSAEQLYVNGESFHIDEHFSQAVCEGCITQLPTKDELSILLMLFANNDIEFV